MTSYDGQFPQIDTDSLTDSTGNATTVLTVGLTNVSTPVLPVILPKMLGDALTFASQQKDMTPSKLAEMTSAVRVLVKVTGLKADELPAAPQQLTPIIEAALPARHRVWAKRWQNAVSSIRALLRVCGLHAPRAKGMPSNAKWAALIAALPDEKQRQMMYDVGRWSSNLGIDPEDFTDDRVHDYAHYRRTQTIRTYVNQVVSGIRIVWNRAVRAGLPGWPAHLLTAPRRSHVVALPLSSFPASFQEDLAAYLGKRTEPDAFDAGHRQWRPATAKAVRVFLIRAASLVANQRGGPEHVNSLADIVTKDAFELILRRDYERAGNVWRGHTGNFANYLMMLARDHVRADATTMARIEELRGIIMQRLREQRKPGLAESVSVRLMPFDDPRMLRRLFQLPDKLYGIAKKELECRPVRAAQTHEQALILDILQHDPMRRYNIATIDYVVDFKRDERGRIIRLWISGERVKNGIAIDTPIPPDLAKRIQTHLNVYRPHLRGSASPWLFPSPQGTSRSPDNVTKTMGRVVARMLGVAFTPHMMRHIIATQLYRQSAHNGVVVQRKLRHTTLKNTERMYGVMSNAGANGEWQAELDGFRRNKVRAAKRAKPSRKRK